MTDDPQSGNEELRALNEEYLTSQEELRSTNEELTTLNAALQSRNLDLARLNDDLTNVIEGADIPILILDGDLRLRRFTPQSDAIVAAIQADVGRPITDLQLKVHVPGFEQLIREVLNSGDPSETEVRAGSRWNVMRMRPYRTASGDIDGVIIALVDIDELKRVAQVAEVARGRAQAVVETMRQPLLTMGPDLRAREGNPAFYEQFAVSAEETVGAPLREIGDGQWDFPELRALLGRVLDADGESDGIEVERDFPRVGRRVVALDARRIREEHDQKAILLAIDDVTDVRRHERMNDALSLVGAIIASTLEFDEILGRVLSEASWALGADSSSVILRQDGTWVMQEVYGLPQRLRGRILEAREVPVSLLATTTEEPVLSADLAHDARFASSIGMELEFRAVLAIPLSVKHETIGSVAFHYRTATGSFSDNDVEFAKRLGTMLSLAFENAKLYSTQRDIAETLQQALLTVPHRVGGVDFGFLYRSATAEAAVGGDFYDLFQLDAGRAGVLLGDVSGKGVQAATLTALVKNTIRALAYENDSPAAVIARTNSVIFRSTPSSMFVTLCYAILDIATGRLTYCSAGQTRGIVKKRSGETELLEVGSPLVGAIEDVDFGDGETMLDEGDVLLLYTDGVTEARRDRVLFGEERLVEFVGRMDPLPAKQMPEAVFAEVMRFTEGTLSDDLAIVAFSKAGPE